MSLQLFNHFWNIVFQFVNCRNQVEGFFFSMHVAFIMSIFLLFMMIDLECIWNYVKFIRSPLFHFECKYNREFSIVGY